MQVKHPWDSWPTNIRIVELLWLATSKQCATQSLEGSDEHSVGSSGPPSHKAQWSQFHVQSFFSGCQCNFEVLGTKHGWFTSVCIPGALGVSPAIKGETPQLAKSREPIWWIRMWLATSGLLSGFEGKLVGRRFADQRFTDSHESICTPQQKKNVRSIWSHLRESRFPSDSHSVSRDSRPTLAVTTYHLAVLGTICYYPTFYLLPTT